MRWPRLADKPWDGNEGRTTYHTEWGTLQMDPERHDVATCWPSMTEPRRHHYGGTLRWSVDCRNCLGRWYGYTRAEVQEAARKHKAGEQ